MGLRLLPLTWSRSLTWGPLVLQQDPNSSERSSGQNDRSWGRKLLPVGREEGPLDWITPDPRGPPPGTSPQPPRWAFGIWSKSHPRMWSCWVLLEGGSVGGPNN